MNVNIGEIVLDHDPELHVFNHFAEGNPKPAAVKYVSRVRNPDTKGTHVRTCSFALLREYDYDADSAAVDLCLIITAHICLRCVR